MPIAAEQQNLQETHLACSLKPMSHASIRAVEPSLVRVPFIAFSRPFLALLSLRSGGCRRTPEGAVQ